ncbi:MAG: RsmD family RNA methyltransferase, partial [Kiritimatiellaeota bacterium]|nr:RsmD family RNA methyltransferase [Kiritimatiellota bacterium]
MRISGGEWCGRKLKAPAGDTVRPTQDRVREALFAMLVSVVPGAAFLDLYAGSGIVGMEALSRGARRATWVEKNPRHVALLKANLETLAPEAPCKVTCMEVERWVKNGGEVLKCESSKVLKLGCASGGGASPLGFGAPPPKPA